MISDTKYKQILALLKKKVTYRAIREKTGAAMATIRKVAEENGIIYLKEKKQILSESLKKPRRSVASINQVIDLLKQELPYREITQLTKVPSSSVSDIAKANGLARGRGNSKKLSHHQPHHKHPRPKYSKHRDVATTLHEEGQSLRAIGAELGTSHQNVSFLLKKPKKK